MARGARFAPACCFALTISLLLGGASLQAKENINRSSMTGLPDIGDAAYGTMVETVELYEKLAGTTLRTMWMEDSTAEDPASWDAAVDAAFDAVRDLHGRALVEYRNHLKKKGTLDGWDHKFPKAWEEWLDDHKEFFKAVQWQGGLQIDQKWRTNDRTARMRGDMRRDAQRIQNFHEVCGAVDEHLGEALGALEAFEAGGNAAALRGHDVRLGLDLTVLRNWTDIASEMDERLAELFGGTSREGYVMKEFHQGFITLRERVASFQRVGPVFHEELEIWETEGKKHLDEYVETMGEYGKKTREYRHRTTLKSLKHLRGDVEGLVPSTQFVLDRIRKAGQ